MSVVFVLAEAGCWTYWHFFPLGLWSNSDQTANPHDSFMFIEHILVGAMIAFYISMAAREIFRVFMRPVA